MPSSDPLRRMSLAIGAGGVIALAAISPVFAGSTTSGSSEDTSACGAVVVQYPVTALMTEVECDEDVVVPGYTDNEDEQVEAEAQDQAAEDQSNDDQGNDQQGEDTTGAKPHKSHQSSDATENPSDSEQANDNEGGEHDNADENDSDQQSGGDESDGGSDDGGQSGSGGSNDD
jgi:hypothetical protein